MGGDRPMGLQKQDGLLTQEGCLVSTLVPTGESFILFCVVLLENVGSKNNYLGVSSADHMVELQSPSL